MLLDCGNTSISARGGAHRRRTGRFDHRDWPEHTEGSLAPRIVAREIVRRRGLTAPVAHAVAFLISLAATACEPPAPSSGAPVLLFAGKGTSAGDVAAVERILNDAHLTYSTATSRQLNRMSTSQLTA